MRTRNKKGYARPGSRRGARMIDQAALMHELEQKFKALQEDGFPRREPDATGLKRWHVPGTEFEGTGVKTRYAKKERLRRRAARRVAHESRRVNR